MKKYNKYFNFQHALVGFFDMGIPIFLVNLSGGFFLAIKAGLIQGLLTFLISGLNTSFFQFLFHKQNKLISILIPSLLTSTIALYIHYISNTPNLFLSWLTVLILALINFTLLHHIMTKNKTIHLTDIIKIYFNKIKNKFLKYEFWNPRIFELPYYLTLIFYCIIYRLHPKNILKVDYSLNHGDINIGSKYEIQKVFNKKYFPKTFLLPKRLSKKEKEKLILNFIKKVKYPIILKSDFGDTGRGLCKIKNKKDLNFYLPKLYGDFICQEFIDYKKEYGVFYIRKNKINKISGINEKHFPYIIGDGINSLKYLIKKNERFSNHWNLFLKDFNLNSIPKKDKKIQLSFIGSHTLGCKFTENSNLLNKKIENKIFKIFKEVPGFNFGRLDIKAKSEKEFLKGNFKIIEINGVSSLPTNMYDPKYSLFDAYKIFLKHAKDLVEIAKENRNKKMKIYSIYKIIKLVKKNKLILEKAHKKLKGDFI